MTRLVATLRRYSSTIPRLPSCSFTPSQYTGLSLDKLKEIRRTKLSPGLTQYYSEPLPLHQGYKQWLFDINGKRYLDMYGGICTVSVGHCHPKVVEAVHKQMQTLGHVSSIYYYSKMQEYAESLLEKMPGKLKVVYFVNSGSEANDLAVLLSRAYTGNFNVFSLQSCYHGMSYQTMALTSAFVYKFPVPQSPGFYKTMNPDVFRGIWGGSNCRDSPIQTDRKCSCLPNQCEAGEKYAEQFKQDIFSEGNRNLAAFFAESIQGVNGAVQFPKNYLKLVYDSVKKTGGLFVSDEVQTGFGRTGENFWGFEMHGIEPDIVTMAKGIGNGFPLAAVVTTPEIAQALTKAEHFNTYGGNPVACAAGLSVLEILEEEKLQENCTIVGNHLLTELEKLKSDNELIGDVRGKGLMIGIEFVNEGGSKIPMEKKKFFKMWENCRDNGLILGKGGVLGNVIRIKPPMCVTKEDADFTVEVLNNALKTL